MSDAIATSAAGAAAAQGELPIHQLAPEAAAAYMRGMYAKSPTFRTLVDTFTARGFQFYFERAKVFLYAGQVERPPGAPCDDADDGSRTGLSANLFGILPSFVEAKRCDTHHTAIGIVVHGAGAAAATSVRVEHGPFQVAEFTLHEPLSDGTVRETSIKTSELARLSVEEIAERLGKHTVTPESLPANSAPLSDVHRERVIATSLEEILADPFASPLYRPEGPKSLLAQLPLVQKFARANRARFTTALGLSLCLATSSTCCNGCTTSSVIITIGDDDDDDDD